MQTTDLSDYNNSPGWKVVHDGTNQLYKIQSEAGRVMSGRFTDRVFAEAHLACYLSKMDAINKRQAQVKSKDKVL